MLTSLYVLPKGAGILELSGQIEMAVDAQIRTQFDRDTYDEHWLQLEEVVERASSDLIAAPIFRQLMRRWVPHVD